LRAGLDTASCANPDRKPQILLVQIIVYLQTASGAIRGAAIAIDRNPQILLVQIIVHLRLCAWRSRLLARLMDGDWVADSSQKRRRNKICAPPSRLPLYRRIFSSQLSTLLAGYSHPYFLLYRAWERN